jgi:hypothetical protein
MTSLRACGQRIALAEILVGPDQDFEQAAEHLTAILSENGYQVGEMEYPKIMRSDQTREAIHSRP